MPPKEDSLKENVKKDIVKKRRKLKETEQGFQTIEQVGVPLRQKKKKLKLIAIRPDKINLTKPPQDVTIGTITLV